MAPCVSTKFDITPAIYGYRHFLKGNNYGKETFRMFHFNMRLTKVDEYYSYPFIKLVTDIGGYIGLILGASAIDLVWVLR